MRDRPRTLFIGTGPFAVPALRVLASSGEIELVGVVTVPARPVGRRGGPRSSPVAEAAAAVGAAPVQAPDRLRSPEAIADILALEPELIVVADYGQIVPRTLLDVPFGALNLHPSLLPRHRGAAPVPATILAGDAITGVALMRMDDGLDTGPLVAVEQIALRGNETGPELEADLAARGAALLGRSLRPWLAGSLRTTPQTADGATLTRPLRRDDGRLDPARAAAELERQIRALQPWPGSWLEVPSGRFTIWRATVGDGTETLSSAPVGALVAVGRGVGLMTGDGVLDLADVQPAGGRRMSGEELVRGRPSLLGECVAAAPAGTERQPIERPVGYSAVP